MNKKEQSSLQRGPFIYENWRVFRDGGRPGPLFEYQLFSDSPIHSEWRTAECPFALVSVRRETPDTRRSPAALVRLRHFRRDTEAGALAASMPPYHGGSLVDEIAALTSLLLGARIKAGANYSRRWDFNDDPLGEAVCTEEPLEVPNARHPILPRLREAKILDNLDQLLDLPKLSPSAASSLILAARSYQEAVWIADQDPNYAWLLLVSATETAASAWSTESAPPLDRMKISRPNVVNILIDAGGQELAERVAAEMADYMGATKKFRDFLVTFCPAPPDDRCEPAYRISWEKKDLKKAFEKIYSFRSRALHGGVAFPLSLSTLPGRLEEVPVWTTSSSLDGHTWHKKDVPMLLHVFEYIVRGALIKWWKSL
jgi:hypothetical protein